MKKAKKISAAVLTAALMATSTAIVAQAEEDEVVIENGVLKSVPKNVTELVIPDSVTSIGSHAFDGCKSLTSVKIPNSVTSIGSGAFWECTSLTSVIIPNSVTTIDSYVFAGCTSLTSVIISNSLTSISIWTFDGCTSLTSVTIPDSVTSIGGDAFFGCTSLKEIQVDTQNKNFLSIDGVLFDSGKTTLIAFPGGKKGSYIIPNSVTSIGGFAFGGCTSLTSVTIPNSVTSISYNTFSECNSLKTVNYTGSKEEWKKIEIGDYNDPLLNATINYNYKPRPEPTSAQLAIADMDGDGRINARDVTAALKIAAKINEFDGTKGDVNGDGHVNAKDVTEMLKYAAGMPSAIDDIK